MITKLQYSDSSERQRIIDENSDKVLIEEQNIIDGNFLIFTDERPITEEVKQLKSKLQQAEADNLTSLKAIADLYEMMLPLLV